VKVHVQKYFFNIFAMHISGRQFYKCGKPQGQGCNYFMWVDDENNPSLLSPGFDNGGCSTNTATASNTFSRPSWEMHG
jgi:hypothetical protein